jgi:Ni,Fe-hydrogenase III large subunit/Ni,Fe-hydrogenase III component G
MIELAARENNEVATPRPPAADPAGVLTAAGVRAELCSAGWPAETRYRVPVAHLATACQTVAATFGAPLTTVVGTDQRAGDGTYHLAYLFARDAEHGFLTIEAAVPAAHPEFPAVTPLVPAAHWHERELQDMFGLRAVGHPDPRRLVLHENFPRDYHPLRKDVPAGDPPAIRTGHPFVYPRVEGEGVFDVPVGPIHAGVIEPGRFLFSVVGEAILKLEARLFFTHRGIEKLVEGRPILHGLQAAERLCGVCAFSHSTAYVQAVESLAATPAPPRAQAIRTLLLELERLYNHIGDLGNLCAGIGFAVGSSHGARLKERLQQLNEVVAGHRFLRGVNTPGGVRRDLDAPTLHQIAATLTSVEHDLRAMLEIIFGSEAVVQRFEGTGTLPLEVVRAFGAVGVTARASGLARDARLTHPHAYYPALTPPVAHAQSGDVRARAEVRVQEVHQALHLVRQVLDNLPAGPRCCPLGPLLADQGVLGSVESPRGEAAHWLMVGPDERISRYHVRSAPYANWPVVPFAVPGNMVPDFPLINKSFELCYACCDR